MARERAEVEAIKKAALELKAKAEADAAAAKWIKDDLMRRFKPVTGAACAGRERSEEANNARKFFVAKPLLDCRSTLVRLLHALTSRAFESAGG